MKYRSLPLLTAVALFTVIWCAQAKTESNLSWPEEIIDSMDGKRLVVFLPHEDIAAGPEWRPAKGAPPLSIAGAMEHLKEWMTSDPRYREAKIQEIELKPIQHHEKEHRWYYLFQLRHQDEGSRKATYAAVLLNGKVVPVIVEPSSIK